MATQTEAAPRGVRYTFARRTKLDGTVTTIPSQRPEPAALTRTLPYEAPPLPTAQPRTPSEGTRFWYRDGIRVAERVDLNPVRKNLRPKEAVLDQTLTPAEAFLAGFALTTTIISRDPSGRYNPGADRAAEFLVPELKTVATVIRADKNHPETLAEIKTLIEALDVTPLPKIDLTSMQLVDLYKIGIASAKLRTSPVLAALTLAKLLKNPDKIPDSLQKLEEKVAILPIIQTDPTRIASTEVFHRPSYLSTRTDEEQSRPKGYQPRRRRK